MVDLVSIQAAALRSVNRLPRRLSRPLVGKPVVVEGQTLHHDMAVVLATQRIAGPPIETLPITKGRKLLSESARIISGKQPIGAVTNRKITGPAGPIPLRFYTPENLTGTAPALVFYHGGGFAMGDLESHDGLCRYLAEQAQVRVISVDYRLAPEAQFPAGVDDSIAAWKWIVENADGLGIDRARIAVGGDSAGGNLAAVIAQEMVHSGGPVPAFQLLIYPVTDFSQKSASRRTFAQGYFLTEELMDIFESAYLAGDEDLKDPRLSPLYGDVTGLPPAYVVTAGFDPLRDEGEAYAAKMAEAGVKVEQVRESGLIHSFANMVGYGTAGPAAVRRCAHALQRGLGR
jgi:acetyl esterase